VPIAKYFVFVGSALFLLLLTADLFLPELPAIFPDQPKYIDRASIRIKSMRKWPEKIVFDTGQPTIVPGAAPMVADLALRSPDDVSDGPAVEALATSKPTARPPAAQRSPVQAKRKLARIIRSEHLAKLKVSTRLARLEARSGCCQPERSKRQATSKHATPSGPFEWHSPGDLDGALEFRVAPAGIPIASGGRSGTHFRHAQPLTVIRKASNLLDFLDFCGE
jgi:hypothetical protein